MTTRFYDVSNWNLALAFNLEYPSRLIADMWRKVPTLADDEGTLISRKTTESVSLLDPTLMRTLYSWERLLCT